VPYFGQLVSWIPLILISFIFKPDLLVQVAIIGAGLLLFVQNIVTPRVMGSAVGLNPVLVLAAVFVGAQVAGTIGAIFGVPVLAVMASLFEAWLDRVRPGESGEFVSTESATARSPAETRRSLQESTAVDGHAVPAAPTMQVRTRAVSRVALPADRLALGDVSTDEDQPRQGGVGGGRYTVTSVVSSGR